MIDVQKILKESKRVEVTLYEPEIDSVFVKQFRKKNHLTQAALANIMGVKKKTIEKWEQGVNRVSGSSACCYSCLIVIRSFSESAIV